MPSLVPPSLDVPRASSTHPDLPHLDRRRSSTLLGPFLASDASSMRRSMAASGSSSRPGSMAGSESSHHRTPAATNPPIFYAAQPTTVDRAPRRKSSAQDAIVPSLQIPSSINNSKGSLAEFAAQITCLFWFESSSLLLSIVQGKASTMPPPRLVPEATPTIGFRKWVTTILSTTQVAQNVILLALMFIDRLKNTNPSVMGRPGSEFRLLTVALMLGNKFLDDNTYTNKTWAEVSGLSVQEIHVMEVEFLSNMRYSLFVSASQWADWHATLRRFWDFFEYRSSAASAAAAAAAASELARRASGPSTPTLFGFDGLPTPPASTHTSPPYARQQAATAMAAYPHPLSAPPTRAPSLPLPPARFPDVDLRPNPRKRSRDETNDAGAYESASKRPAPSHGPPPPPRPPSTASVMAAAAAARLPAPRTLAMPMRTSHEQHPPPMSAPWPLPGTRAMASVYGAPSTDMRPPPVTMPPALNTQLQPLTTHLAPYLDPTHRTSPFPVSAHASPAGAASFFQLPSTTTTTTTQSMSPSYILTHRSSPYRPVREVSTLLVPPHMGMTQAAPQHLPHHQMQYQPLGKARSDYRTGVVPYLHQEVWPPSTQTPLPWVLHPTASHPPPPSTTPGAPR
ncbi:MAG: hypothetical protein M1823_006261 [Watsoniomyces obsoletus]|nr:MAG: hypothetical protein M1823_006261 [Watsoniomyces obsoletus]